MEFVPEVDLDETARRLIEDHYLPKVERQIRRAPDAFPHVTESGRWVTTRDGWWTGGFWIGQLWLLWKVTGDPALRSALDRYLSLLAPRWQADEFDADLGFLYTYSFGLGRQLTGDETYGDIPWPRRTGCSALRIQGTASSPRCIRSAANGSVRELHRASSTS